MKKISLPKILLFFVFGLSVTSCTQNEDDVRVMPNNIKHDNFAYKTGDSTNCEQGQPIVPKPR